MNWDDLPLLLAVAREGSLNGAAEVLGLNQTTVSRRLETLEEETGSRLVERARTGATLTPAGERAFELVEQMEGLALEIERSLLGGDARLSGTLRITTTDTLVRYEPRLFSSFGERYPDVELIVGTSYAETSLARRGADIALRWTNTPNEALFGRKMVRAEYALYVSKKLYRKVRSRNPAKYPWLAWDPGSGARITDNWMKANVPDATVVCRYDSAIGMHQAILAGAGIAFMPVAFGDQERSLQRLARVEDDFGYDIWCLTHPDLSKTARVRAFMSHAAEYFNDAKCRYGG